ncbi:hypothetical protein [Acinetobacter haemolyticus]|uniref:hypothetical protein n=1 Tax=Acinetobacter haemolyticus TaxID=29430 RepID=UPI0024DE40A1|nr:hypothetical protein [Acinetobacter haemolyticus]
MKKTCLWVCLIFGSFSLSACSNSFESELMQSCQALGGERKFCHCTMTGLQGYYGKERLIAAAERKQPLPEDYNQVATKLGQQCYAKLYR